MSVFTLSPVPEIHLASAPLAKVLMQVQFSRTPVLVSAETEAALAAMLLRYPVRRQGAAGEIAFSLGLGGAQPLGQAMPSTLRLFSDMAGEWQVTLTETSVALETTVYESRDDFCRRATEIFSAVASAALPPVVDRVGLRYISRLTGDHLSRISEYVVPELRVLNGGVGGSLALEHSVSDTLIRIADTERLQARSGLIPPNGGFDPALGLLAEPSWLLDLDVFTVKGGMPFDPLGLESQLRRYAEHAYSFFRFATTEAFQSEFGRSAADIGGQQH